MMPTIICSGFRRCGVYPFDPHAIDCRISTDNPEASLTISHGGEIEKGSNKKEDGENSHEQ